MSETPVRSRSKRRRRVVVTAVLMVFMGASTMLGVTWGLALRDVPGGAERATWSVAAGGASGSVVRYRATGARVYEAHLGRGLGSRVEEGDVTPWYMRRAILPWLDDPSCTDQFRFVNARGWPLPAFYCIRHGTFVTGGEYRGAIMLGATYEWTYGGTAGTAGYAEVAALPYLPVWVGLIADVVVYTGGWWMVAFGIGRIRRWRRRRRGRCLTCGYDLQGTPAEMRCPECGAERRIP